MQSHIQPANNRSGIPALEMLAEALLAVHEVTCAEAAELHDELVAIARDSELARRLRTVPGVGPIVALSFIATVDDVGRFSARDPKATSCLAVCQLFREAGLDD